MSAPEQLGETERHLLASLADAPGISISTIEAPIRCGEGWLLAEAISTEAQRWAGDNQAALTFGPDWGQVENMLCAITSSAIPPLDAARIDAEKLRPPALGDQELDIGKELNGNLTGYGKRFWEYLSSAYEPVHMLLEGNDPIRLVCYQDRYLFSPISVKVLLEIIKGLRDRAGEMRWPDPVMEIKTLKRCPKKDGSKQPKYLGSNWNDNEVRAEVIQTLFSEVGMRPQVQLDSRQNLAHGRLLDFVFASGKRLRIRFDQGVSYWRVSRSADYSNKSFDFTKDAIQQAEALLAAEAPVEGCEQKTQLFIKVTNE